MAASAKSGQAESDEADIEFETVFNNGGNVSTPGAEAGSCSAISEYGKVASSISCAKG